jgi:hypothetical protein
MYTGKGRQFRATSCGSAYNRSSDKGYFYECFLTRMYTAPTMDVGEQLLLTKNRAGDGEIASGVCKDCRPTNIVCVSEDPSPNSAQPNYLIIHYPQN